MSGLLGPEARKIQPKLRMIADGSSEVNLVRAEHCSPLAIDTDKKDVESIPVLRGEQPVALPEGDVPMSPRLRQLADDVLVNVFIETQDAAEKEGEALPDSFRHHARRANLVAATVKLSELPALAKHGRVMHIELGEPIAAPTPEVSRKSVGEPAADRWRFGDEAKHKDGEDVLIGIIDVQGFDFAHPDFRDGDRTRFVHIWDQGGTARPSPHQQDPHRFDAAFDFGAEFRQDHLNRAIAAESRLRLSATEIERQSQRVLSSHGTHVASIAAGNRGVCRKAMIAGVLIALAGDDLDRRRSFCDSTRIAHAIDYLLHVADDLSRRRKRPVPVSINISLGTNGHAHDGTGASTAGSTRRWPSRAGASRSPPGTPGRSARPMRATSATSWAASTPAARYGADTTTPTSSGRYSATASLTSRRTSSRSGTASRIDSKSWSARRGSTPTGSARSHRESTSRIASSRAGA